MKRFLSIAILGVCLCAGAADSTIGNLTPITTVPDVYRMPWENPGTIDYYITFANLTNQILSGYASQTYAQSLTNGLGSYGCLAMGTGTVVVATSTSSNLFTAYNYQDRLGAIGIETNSNFVITNGGQIRVSFGDSMLGGNGDTVKTMIFTNGVDCAIVNFSKVMANPAISETGFKEFVVLVPAMCRISLYIANTAANNVSVQNLCFNVRGAN